MKKTILAGAVVLAFSSVAIAQDIEGTQAVTIPDKKAIENTTYNLKDKAEFTVTGVTNEWGLLKNSPISGENATLFLNAKGTGDINAALGYGGSNIKVHRVEITSEERGIYSSADYAADHSIEANYVTITSKNKDAIYTNTNNIKIIGNNSVYIKSSHDSAIANNSVQQVVEVSGGNVTIESDGDDAIHNYQAGTTKIVANDLVIHGAGGALEKTEGVVWVDAGTVELNGKNSISVTVDTNDKNALYSNSSGKLTISSPEAQINGNIEALGETQLNGELVFNGNTANIEKLTGDSATFTITKADQSVTINNANKALTVAATGDLNDEIGTAAFDNLKVSGTTDGVQVVAREGMYAEETTATYDEAGNLSQFVKKDNSIMSNVLDLMSNSTLSLNRILMNDVRKRMGDLRASEGTHGVWARYDGGKFSGSNSFENDFSTVQIGADTAAFLDGTRLGVAFSYTTSDSDMQRGDAEMDAYSLAFYGTKFFENGMFVDVIGRLATIDTDVTIDGNKKGNLDNMAVSLSGEFGWRFDVNQSFYVEPQAEVTYTYLDSDKLKLSSGHEYELDSVDSLIGRLGFATGFKCPNNFGDVYLRASAVHEFLGDAAVHGGTYTLETDGDDTWIEFGVGANFNLNKNLYGWVDLERTEGADLDEDWRANVGVRYSF